MIIMAVAFKEKMGKRKLLCAIVCIMGVIMLYSPEKHAGVKGMTLAVISGIVYSLYVIFWKNSVKWRSAIIISFWLMFFYGNRDRNIFGINWEIPSCRKSARTIS